MNKNGFGVRTGRILGIIGFILLVTLARGHGPVAATSKVSIVTASEGDTWLRVADMPTGRCCLAAASVGGKIYAIGGRTGSLSIPSSIINAVEEYNPLTNVWRSRAPMPTPRTELADATAVVNGRIYVFGGYDGNDTTSVVEEYDPSTDTWRSRAPIPTARERLATAVVNERIYAIGGSPSGWPITLSTVEEYDPATDTWRSRAPMPTARYDLSAAVVDGRIYAIGGWNGEYLAVVEEYDPATNQWRSLAPMSLPRGTAVALMGKIYAIRGKAGDEYFATMEAYNPTTNQWVSQTPMLTPRVGLAAAALDGKFYAIGGYDGTNWLSIVEEYTPPGPPEAPPITGWLAGWEYRKSHTVQGFPTGPLSNYQIQLTVHYDTGVDKGDAVYIQGQCQPDFGDLRFTTSDGQTELDYWIEQKVDGDYALVWVEVVSNPESPSTTTIFIYYDNPEATDASDGTATFVYFDDFETYNTGFLGGQGGWKDYVLSNETARVSTALAKRGANSVYVKSPDSHDANQVLGSELTNKVVDFDVYFDQYGIKTGPSKDDGHFTLFSGTEKIFVVGHRDGPNHANEWLYNVSEEGTNHWVGTKSQDTWYKVSIYITPTGMTIMVDDSTTLVQAHPAVTRFDGIGFYGDEGAVTYFDSVRIRNYISPEPVHGIWGGEEKLGSPIVTVMSPNGGEYWYETQPIIWTATDPQDDLLVYTISYSPNQGQTWTQLATGLTESSYAWDTTLVVDGTKYLIRVEASDGEHIGTDMSDATFEIANAPPNSTPTVQVIQPNGGERVMGIYTLMWEATDSDGDTLTFTVSYSPNGGQTWTQLAQDLTGPFYQWDTSKVQEGTNYLVQVEVSDSRLTAKDRSDASFTIEHETAPTTSSDTGGNAFIPSFGAVEALIAILFLMGLGQRRERRVV